MVSLNLFTLIVLGGFACAWQLGRMYGTPVAKWKKGALKDLGWKAWQPVLYGIVGVAGLLTIMGDDVRARIPFMSSMGGGYGGGGYGGGGW